jgi:hypothetical protein
MTTPLYYSPGYHLWTYTAPVLTTAASPLLSPWFAAEGYSSVLLGYVFAGGVSTLTFDASTDGINVDSDLTTLQGLVVPAVPATTVQAQNTNNVPVRVVITAAGAAITAVVVNGLTVGSAAGTYMVPAYGGISISFTGGPPTWAWSVLSGTVVPLIAPYFRVRVVQTSADNTITKIFMKSRA